MVSILSWNYWGFNGASKCRHLRRLMLSKHPDFVVLQETKCQSIGFSLLRRIWGMGAIKWHSLDAINSAGGILIS